jgi:hypothetical protein
MADGYIPAHGKSGGESISPAETIIRGLIISQPYVNSSAHPLLWQMDISWPMGKADLKHPDEAIHLAAGMLWAGYHIVIATMWSIDDGDAPVIADAVYSHLLADKEPSSQKAAEALHFAVQTLCKHYNSESFVSWVPFIHMAAWEPILVYVLKSLKELAYVIVLLCTVVCLFIHLISFWCCNCSQSCTIVIAFM